MIKINNVKFDEFISDRIVKMRKQGNLTQAELAEKVNVSVRTIVTIESGDSSVSFEKFMEIAEACDYEVVADGHSFTVRPKEA